MFSNGLLVALALFSAPQVQTETIHDLNPEPQPPAWQTELLPPQILTA